MGSKPVVTWKDEDQIDDVPVGPCLILQDGRRLFDMGWMTQHAARKLAEERHYDFEEL
jgi:hypothetical protein